MIDPNCESKEACYHLVVKDNRIIVLPKSVAHS
jgi:hypothetical protein